MKIRAWLRIISSLSLVALTAAVGCGGDSAPDKGGASLGVVSCDIYQLGMHYCEEAPGKPGTDTGCPTMMTGFTPGSGCSRTGVTGTCSSQGYEFFLYTAGVSASALASICPGGKFEPTNLDGGVTISSAGAASVSTSGTCADLEKCCNSSSNAQLKASCLETYKTALSSGDSVCASFLPIYKLALNCQ